MVDKTSLLWSSIKTPTPQGDNTCVKGNGSGNIEMSQPNIETS